MPPTDLNFEIPSIDDDFCPDSDSDLELDSYEQNLAEKEGTNSFCGYLGFKSNQRDKVERVKHAKRKHEMDVGDEEEFVG